MYRALLLSVTIIPLIQIPCFGGEKITIKKGDTLTKIASENNLSIREIMDINGIFDANKVKEGQVINIPISRNNSEELIEKFHSVKRGESLNKISKDYKISKDTLIKINNLKNPDQLQVGQKIQISKNSNVTNLNENKSFGSAINSQVLDKNTERLIKISKLKTTAVETSKQVSLKRDEINIKKMRKMEWEKFGPLKVNWGRWKYANGSHIAPSIHISGKPLFLAVNCSSRRLNRTDSTGEWRNWIAPIENFEHELLNKRCEKTIN